MVKKDVNSWNRWLHIYLSMFSFAALLFFAVTGITLNHPSWVEGQQKAEIFNDTIDIRFVQGNDSEGVDRLMVVEYFREKYRIRAGLTDFRVDEYECSLSFNGPGYTADCFIDRSSGSYQLTITTAGYIALLNDLHKGRDAGGKWAVLIDVSAVLMVLVSLTGFIMIFFITRRKLKGLWVAVLGAVTLILLYFILV